MKLLEQFIEEYPTHLQFADLVFVFKRHQDHLIASIKTKADCDKICSIYEKVLQHSSNASSVQVWLQFIEYLEKLDDIYESICGDNLTDLESEREQKMKQIFERAIDNVGFTHVDATEIWTHYIDFETLRNNLTIVNLLCYLSLEQP